ncbi:MAG: gliding motility-associated C-terminal domain-containing protein [Thermoanaerobaculia bacterium]|nr:gliding motility-associated C-terminal domain-containing protein [Thermoanaerobaculia bacterium]
MRQIILFSQLIPWLLAWLLPTCLKSQTFFWRDTFCSNQILLINGHLYGPDNPVGTEILPGASASGADSIIEVRLVFYQPSVVVLDQIRCQTDTVWINGVPYHANYYIGEETIEGGAANGCDSIIKVNLTFSDRVISKIEQPICEGDTIMINGAAYSAFRLKGEEIIAGGATGGCDSVVQIMLTPVPLPFIEITDTLCPDSFLIINGTRYDNNNRSGLEILPNAGYLGCDSLVNVRLTFRELWVALGEDLELGAGDSICITPLYNFRPDSLIWTPTPPCVDPDCFLYCKTFFAGQQFQVAATGPGGCVLRDTIQVKVRKQPNYYAANVFKPDAQWPNNYFSLNASAGISLVRYIQIADRWGEILWERHDMPLNDPESGWNGMYNGKMAPPGVYIFWAELEWWDGTKEIASGSFTLLR